MDFGLDWDGLAGAVPFAGHTVKLEIDAELIAAPASPAATETVAGLEALIESLGPRELADLRRALDRVARAVERPPGAARPAGRTGRRPAPDSRAVRPGRLSGRGAAITASKPNNSPDPIYSLK